MKAPLDRGDDVTADDLVQAVRQMRREWRRLTTNGDGHGLGFSMGDGGTSIHSSDECMCKITYVFSQEDNVTSLC